VAALWMLIVGIIYGSSVLYVAAPYLAKLETTQSQLTRRDIYDLAVALDEASAESNNVDFLPLASSLSAIDGYGHLRFFSNQRIIKSGGGFQPAFYLSLDRAYVDSSGFRGRSGLVAATRYRTGESITEAVARIGSEDANACGNTKFSDGGPWCLSSEDDWHLYESTSRFPSFLSGESQRLKTVITKFYRRYGSDGKFTDLSDGSVVSLAAQSGYVGTEENCSGVHLFEAVIPLTCMDMFNRWGGNIMLQVENSNSIVLVNETSIIRNGQNVVLAEEAKLE
jgi:hypothetical protein